MRRVKEDIQSYVSQASEHRFDIAEIVITNLFFREGLSLGTGHRCLLVNIALELFDNKLLSEDGYVIWSGSFDGLASLKFLTLRLVPGTPRVRVEILKRAFEACDSLFDDTRKVWKKSMVHVMSWLRPEVMTSEARYGTRFNDVTEAETTYPSKQPRFDAAGFYEAIKPSKMDPMLEDGLTDLLPELRPYQQRAAYWMLMPLTFVADEMGLGKTVELLACIFVHRKLDKGIRVQCDMCNARQHADCVGKGKGKKAEKVSQKKSKEYFCKNCPVSTGATLIVCPAPILKQWESEIKRHTRSGSLVTCTYGGVRKASLSCEPTFDITELLSADIVLTTYDVLRQDLAYVCDNGDRRRLRFQKRYPFVHTPLTKIFWWRICLDEAQMVENNTSAAAEMALRLYTKHRWCITGTPIQRKLDDLFGLLKFLKASPFDVSRWWTEVIRDPYERRDAKAMEFTHKFFKQVMWHSSKVHVADELQLPPQDKCVSWLEFSAIERYYYSRQHDTCVSYAREVIETMKNDILKRGHSSSDNHLVTHAEAGKLLNSLLKLRQACCHPQVGGDAICSLQQTPMTMEEILMVLVDKTRNEGVKALGMLNLALNNLAYIAVFKQNISEALSLYKEALAITEEHAEDFPLDLLLNIHILQNLVETRPLVESYSGKGSASGSSNHRAAKRKRKRTTQKEDGEYHEECKTLDRLKVKYLSAFNSKLSAAQHEFTKSNNRVSESLSDMGKQHSGWWVDALQIAEQSEDISRRLTRKIEEAIHGSLDNSSSSRATSRFRTIHGTKLHLRTCMDTLQSSRETLLSKLLEIDQTMEKPKLEDIERIGNCKYCQKKDGPMCVHCELDKLFKEYEGRLSETVLVLRVIRKHCKTYLNDESQLAAKKHLQTLKVRKKECAHASLLASAQANLLLAYDNIKIRQSALSLDKLEADIEKNTKEKFSAQSSLRSNKGKLRYLKHGANGLNLLEAQHVILVEPLINPAAEAQAVGRVHRIGQEKPTLVHRFLVTGTVEESISKLNKSRNTHLCSFTSRTTKNHDQQGLTLRDLESVFASPAEAEAEDTEENPGR
ncbi:unnamed protein product [Cochlearia groenlandica]